MDGGRGELGRKATFSKGVGSRTYLAREYLDHIIEVVDQPLGRSDEEGNGSRLVLNRSLLLVVVD